MNHYTVMQMTINPPWYLMVPILYDPCMRPSSLETAQESQQVILDYHEDAHDLDLIYLKTLIFQQLFVRYGFLHPAAQSQTDPWVTTA